MMSKIKQKAVQQIDKSNGVAPAEYRIDTHVYISRYDYVPAPKQKRRYVGF